MTTRAQLSQERSRQRREELLSAAIELFSEGGARAVTHRAVAKRAGLPPATTTYYFTSIEELLREALAEHIQSWRDELDVLSGFDSMSDMNLKMIDATSLISQVWAARGPDIAGLELAIYLAACQDESLREAAREALIGFEALGVRWLQLLHVPEPEKVIPALLALIAGTALRRQAGQYSEEEEAELMSRGIRDLIGAHLLGRDEIDALLTQDPLPTPNS